MLSFADRLRDVGALEYESSSLSDSSDSDDVDEAIAEALRPPPAAAAAAADEQQQSQPKLTRMQRALLAGGRGGRGNMDGAFGDLDVNRLASTTPAKPAPPAPPLVRASPLQRAVNTDQKAGPEKLARSGYRIIDMHCLCKHLAEETMCLHCAREETIAFGRFLTIGQTGEALTDAGRMAVQRQYEVFQSGRRVAKRRRDGERRLCGAALPVDETVFGGWSSAFTMRCKKDHQSIFRTGRKVNRIADSSL